MREGTDGVRRPSVEDVVELGRGQHSLGPTIEIRVPEVAGDSHVDIIDRPEIELAGQQTLGSLLRYVPAVAGNSTSTLISNGGDGTATVTLRGLPASNTLVLLNGRRVNPDGLMGQSIDLNTLPIGLVERVEILKDGASAIYGSDAIAGVVNVITRRDISGVHVNTYYGQSIEGDLDTFNSDVIWGRDFDDVLVTVGATYFDQGALWSRDRALSASSDDRSRGGIDKRSSATLPARIGLDSGAVVLRDSDLAGSDPDHFRLATDEDRFEYRDYTTSIVPSRRWSAFADVEGSMTSGGTFYIETMYTDTRATNTLAPLPLFTGFEVLDLTVSADNPFNAFGVDIDDVRRRLIELPPAFRKTSRRPFVGSWARPASGGA